MPAVLVIGPSCYAKLAVSSLATIANTHCAYPWRYGQAEYRLSGLVKYQDAWYTRERSRIPVLTEPDVEQLR